MKPIVFSDLDDTIFQTARKMPNGLDNATLASEALNGSHSYMTPSQQLLMQWLQSTTRFIPVTARSTEALERCKLKFTDYQVCSNGAIILKPDGTPDTQWLEKTTSVAQAAASVLQALMDYVHNHTDAGRFRCWIVKEYGCGFYFCVKSNEGAQCLDDIDQRLSQIAGKEMTRHRNDNNLSFTPADISKRHAVEHLAARLLSEEPAPVLGMGDSLTDLPFMASCDMLVIPKNSQIARQRLTDPR